MDMSQLCQYLTPERLTSILADLGLAHLTTRANAIRAAVCGDVAAAALVEAAASASPGCRCKGRTVAAIQAAIQATAAPAPMIPFARPIGGGGVISVGKVRVLRNGSDDWNCRTDGGDLDACEITKIASEEYLSIPVAINAITNWADYGLPNPGATNVWFVGFFDMHTLATDRISQLLCLESWLLNYTDTLTTPFAPLTVRLAGEKVADDGEKGLAHVWDFWQTIPRRGYEITDARCRCVDEVCVCLPYQGRMLIAFLGPGTPAVSITGEIEWRRRELGPVCGPCPPDRRCDRSYAPSDPCDPPTLRPVSAG